MKKITLIAFALGTLCLMSCKKTRTCTCTGTTTTVTTLSGAINSSTSDSTPESYVETLPSATKKTAKGKADCNSRIKTYSDSYTSGGTTYTEETTQDMTCTIK
jgi:hypothetical protein